MCTCQASQEESITLDRPPTILLYLQKGNKKTERKSLLLKSRLLKKYLSLSENGVKFNENWEVSKEEK